MLRKEVVAFKDELISVRRDLHRHPELKFEEVRTAQIITQRLQELGLEVETNKAKTGVIGILKGTSTKGEPSYIMLRADMDALPILERTTSRNAEYISQTKNVMHACGHDGHVSILLCVAKILTTQFKDKINGQIKFVFQPGEENGFGARMLIEEGLLDEKVDQVYGLHLWNAAQPYIVQVGSGPATASSDRFYITINGAGGHGSMPHQTLDPIPISSSLVAAIQTIVSRNVSPLDSAVVSIGKIEGGYSENVISDTVSLQGTVRTFTLETQNLIKKRLSEICQGIGQAFEVKIDFEYRVGYPPTINTEKESENVRLAALKIVGEKGVEKLKQTMAGEDFSYYLQKKPGSFFFVGSNPGQTPSDYPHHSPQFDINEDSLLIGASVFLQLVEDLMVH